MSGEAPQEPESCSTCGGDWEECRHDWVPDGRGGYVLTSAVSEPHVSEEAADRG